MSSQTEGCLALWAPAAFEARAEEMTAFMRSDVTSRDRNMARVFFAGAQEANPDSQGRIAIPQNLRNFAGLTKSVMVNGAGDHVEIWDADTWARIQGDGEAALHSSEPSATSEATEFVGAPA